MVVKKKLSLTINKKEEPEVEQCDDRIRINGLLNKILGTKMGNRCEKSIYDYLRSEMLLDFPDKKFKREYLSLSFNLIENLDPESEIGNDYLLPKVKNGEIPVEELAQMNDQELYPIKWQKIKEKRLDEIKAECVYADPAAPVPKWLENKKRNWNKHNI